MLTTAARAACDGVGGGPGRGDRLVQTDRGAQRAGQRGVPGEVVLGQWLFDQQQVERVEAGQLPGVGERVGGVGVDLEE